MTTSETQEEVQHVDSSVLDAPLNPVKVDRSFLGKIWYVLRRYPVIPLIVLAILVIAAAVGPSIAPYERDIGPIGDRHLGMFKYSELAIEDQDAPKYSAWPAGFHLFGSDHIGRDVFTRVLHGARISMQVVLVSLVLGMFIGVSLGMISGYYGGITDEVITRFVDIWYAMPFLMVALIVVLIFGRGLTVLLFLLLLLLLVCCC